MRMCQWCGAEDVNITLSNDGDDCCDKCINKANESAKPIKVNSDIDYLNREELIELVYNMSIWNGHYNKDDLNEILINYKRNK